MHRASLESAARGAYDEAALANVSPGRVERYFSRRAGSFDVVPDLRQRIVFAAHNLIKDPPFTRVNLVASTGSRWSTRCGPTSRSSTSASPG